jgi:hypothetical protein
MTTAPGFELGSDRPTTLVVGVDGSDASWRALDYTFGLARRQHATVLAVFAAHELNLAIQALAADYCVRTEFTTRRGDPVNILIRYRTPT